MHFGNSFREHHSKTTADWTSRNVLNSCSQVSILFSYILWNGNECSVLNLIDLATPSIFGNHKSFFRFKINLFWIPAFKIKQVRTDYKFVINMFKFNCQLRMQYFSCKRMKKNNHFCRFPLVVCSYPERRSPTAEYHTTKHHSVLYTHTRRYSLEPSTSLANEPKCQHTHIHVLALYPISPVWKSASFIYFSSSDTNIFFLDLRN